jgi:histidinol-phosphate aminotransferase
MSYFRQNIEQLTGYSPGYQPRGGDVVKLNTNENPYPPSPAVIEAIRGFDPEKLRRYPQPLADDFRSAAAKLLGVSAGNIMATNGGDDLLTIAVRSFCGPGRALAYPVPTYSLYPVLAKIQDCPAVEVPFDGDFNLPAALADASAALTIVCNPNAPTASFVQPAEIEKLARRLEGKGVVLVDEAYVDYAPANCIGLVKSCGNVIILRSLSKGYSLAGLRFGYAVANEGLIDGMMKVKDSYNVDAIAIAAATAAITDRKYFQTNIDRIKSQRTILTESLRGLGFELRDSSTNFLPARCPDGNASDMHQKLAKRNIYVRYFNLPGLTDKLRITVGTEEQNRRLVDALNELIRK